MSDGPGPLAGRRILVLEDEYFIADELARTLTRAGAAVLGPFGHVDGAMRALATGPRPDLGILDVNVHGDRSYPVAEALTASGVPIIFVTGYDSPVLDPAWADTPICHKPVDGDRLVKLLPALADQP
jgi:DNA-binding response OmpR family regulator